jgi:TRAP-type mannitol/chloroaromatic compound transport system permease large subunit
MDLPLIAALIMFSGTLFFLIIGTPISISVGISSFGAMLAILPFQGAIVTSSQRIFVGLDSFALLAIPFFILAGNIMNNGGIAIRLINFSQIISGRFPGSLALRDPLINTPVRLHFF